jgi:hypothetical protein
MSMFPLTFRFIFGLMINSLLYTDQLLNHHGFIHHVNRMAHLRQFPPITFDIKSRVSERLWYLLL